MGVTRAARLHHGRLSKRGGRGAAGEAAPRFGGVPAPQGGSNLSVPLRGGRVPEDAVARGWDVATGTPSPGRGGQLPGVGPGGRWVTAARGGRPAVPQVLRSCTQFVEQHGVVDGIYRLSGVSSNIQRLR